METKSGRLYDSIEIDLFKGRRQVNISEALFKFLYKYSNDIQCRLLKLPLVHLHLDYSRDFVGAELDAEKRLELC